VKRIGIIGCGSFGMTLAGLLAPLAQIHVFDKDEKRLEEARKQFFVSDFQTIAKLPIIIIATELNSFEEICKKLAKTVNSDTIVVDVCSVKVKPAKIFNDYLGGHCRLLLTHPLFGPNSIADNDGTCEGMTVVWHELSGGPFNELKNPLEEKLGLKIRTITPEEHDKQMAWVHGLTFFIGRGLLEMNLPKLTLGTGYFNKLNDLLELEKTHSEELFETIELGNPFAGEVRDKFIHELENLNNKLEKEATNEKS